ncbi:hypothetical protein LEN26_019511 [Aphanomyces euteiches]|nr:hypothetical protein LEN26_019511 [Aphanomyces euteiches]
MGVDVKAASGRTVDPRREHNLGVQREYRRKRKNERIQLLNELAALQIRASTFTPGELVDQDGKLSWRVVASVFQEESRRSKDKLHGLRDLVHANTSLILEMTRFLEACQPRSLAEIVAPCVSARFPPCTRRSSSTSETVACPAALHNTDRAFNHFPRLDDSNEFIQCNAECTGEWINMIEGFQATWPHALEDIKQFFTAPESQSIICFSDEIDVERDGNTVLAARIFEEKYPWHLLQGHFHEADRFIVVMRHLNYDEAGPSFGNPNFHEMEWIDVRRVAPTCSIVRFLGHRTMQVEFVREFAQDLGTTIMTPDESTTEREVVAFSKKVLWDFQLRLQDMLARNRSKGSP